MICEVRRLGYRGLAGMHLCSVVLVTDRSEVRAVARKSVSHTTASGKRAGIEAWSQWRPSWRFRMDGSRMEVRKSWKRSISKVRAGNSVLAFELRAFYVLYSQ